MRVLYFLFCMAFFTTTSYSQNFYLPELEQAPNSFDLFLVQLAWQYTPSNRALEFQQNITKEATKIARLSWTRAFGFNFGFNQNANENDPNMPGEVDPILFPRVSIGASLNINPLLTTGAMVRMAKEEEKIAESQLYQEQVELKETVLVLYEEYLLAKEILKVRVKTEEDAKATFELIKELFKKSEVSFEDYNTANTSYHEAVEAQIEAQTKVKISKLALEKWIGMPLDKAAQLFGVIQE